MSMLDAAHAYGRRGWRVTPLHHMEGDQVCSCHLAGNCPEKNRGKHPVQKAWQNNASSSGADIQEWWEEHPDANIGIATGRESGIWVLDIDGAPGFASLTTLVEEYGPLPATRICRTGSGGLHYYWRHPNDFHVVNSTSWLGEGVDVRGRGGQVVAPPSVSGRGEYALIADHDVADAPTWLVDRIREHAANYEAGRTAKVKTAEPVDLSFLPDELRRLATTIVEEDKGRFRHFHSLVAACREAGFTQGQAVTIAEPWCRSVDKFVGRVPQEVARCWGKLDAAQAKLDAWLPPTNEGTAALASAPVVTTQAETSTDDEGGDDDADPMDAASWAPIDLTDIVNGNHVPEEPTGMPRGDGIGLLYPGRVHSLHGESESGKSLVAQAEGARRLADPDGGPIFYLDFESDQAAVVTRLMQMGAPGQAILERLDYIRPEVSPFGMEHEREAWRQLLGKRYSYGVIDGVTEAVGTYGVQSSMDNDEMTTWMRRVPRKLAQATGAAVVLVDHVTKNSEGRGRFAIGAQAKMSALDGAAYSVEVVEALGRGLSGAVSLRVAKDRPGGVRPHCGPFRKSDRTQEAARVLIDSTDGSTIKVSVRAPERTIGDAPEKFRPTALMERVSTYLASLTGGAGAGSNELVEAVGGKADFVRKAASVLVEEGYARMEKQGQKNVHIHVKPYFEGIELLEGETPDPNRVPASPPRPTASPDAVATTLTNRVPASPTPKGDAVRDVVGEGQDALDDNEPRPKIVHRAVAGVVKKVNLDTGEVVD